MKRCRKPPEPKSLAQYRAAQPNSTWEEMRADPHHGGQQAYLDIKSSLVRAQRGLCAFCETPISKGLGDQELGASSSRQRVEHIHPKSDTGGAVNWALEWGNLWAVCLGGSSKPPEGEPIDPSQYLPPLPANLSCDAFKDHQIRKGRLNLEPDGWIIAPDQVPAFPRLFKFAPDGTPEPDENGCDSHQVTGNRHSDTATLIAETIKHLNLGCSRLNRSRCIAKARLENTIKKLRERHRGADAQGLLIGLARQIFKDDASSPWVDYFTLVRWRLGEPAEQRLQEMGFDG